MYPQYLNPWKRKDSPCICPIVNSLSSRSVPASSSNFPPLAARNFELSPTNQFSQNGCVALRLVRQVHVEGVEDENGEAQSREGTETRADKELRIVRVRMLKSQVVSATNI